MSLAINCKRSEEFLTKQVYVGIFKSAFVKAEDFFGLVCGAVRVIINLFLASKYLNINVEDGICTL